LLQVAATNNTVKAATCRIAGVASWPAKLTCRIFKRGTKRHRRGAAGAAPASKDVYVSLNKTASRWEWPYHLVYGDFQDDARRNCNRRDAQTRRSRENGCGFLHGDAQRNRCGHGAQSGRYLQRTGHTTANRIFAHLAASWRRLKGRRGRRCPATSREPRARDGQSNALRAPGQSVRHAELKTRCPDYRKHATSQRSTAV
jgi:hypothetical protein